MGYIYLLIPSLFLLCKCGIEFIREIKVETIEIPKDRHVQVKLHIF